MQPAPIFILGVPRSGTTLLRAILDSHSAIACGPETPWLCAHQPRSVMALWRALRDEEWGYCHSFNMPREVPTRAAREFVTVLMQHYAAARNKRRWAEKTPDNLLHLDFLIEAFPEARFIHLERDGLDVAMSTSIVAEHRKGISEFLESRIGFGPDAPAVNNTPFAAMIRWRHWNNLIKRALAGRDSHRVSYEQLVKEPETTLRGLMQFIGEDFEPAMLEYAKARHEYPKWEWGSADVRERGSITTDRIGRAQRELSPEMYAALAPMLQPGGTGAEASSHAPADAQSAALLSGINSLASGLGLDLVPEADARALWGAWVRHLAGDWSGKSLVSRLPMAHPVPWLLALQGASVRIATGTLSPALQALAAGLRVDLAPGDKGDIVLDTDLLPH